MASKIVPKIQRTMGAFIKENFQFANAAAELAGFFLQLVREKQTKNRTKSGYSW